MELYVTDKQGEKTKKMISGDAEAYVENQVLNIYPDMEFQTFEGFGGALTDASGYVFSHLTEEQQDELLTMYFDEKQMGYTQVRIPVDSCDFSTHLYEADGCESDENLEKFSFADTERYILPLLEAAQKKAGKRLKLMLSPWSPPAYMKTNSSRVRGGELKPEYRKRSVGMQKNSSKEGMK